MTARNIKFTSNIEPVKGEIRYDISFLRKIHDFKALEQLQTMRVPLSPEQQIEYNRCSHSCEYALEKNDYVFGIPRDAAGPRQVVCRCINDGCQFFSDCRNNQELTNEELEPWIENESFKAQLRVVDDVISAIEDDPKSVFEEELHVAITDDGIVLTTDVSRPVVVKKAAPYSPIDSYVTLNDGADISYFVKPGAASTVDKTPLFESWIVQNNSTLDDLKICTAQTMRSIKALEAEENRKLDAKAVAIQSELARAQANGKHTASGYDFIKSELSKDLAISSKINVEYARLTKKLTVQSHPLDSGTVSYGSKVSIKDVVNGNMYSFVILGDEDSKFLQDYRIVPYTSKLGSAFYGARLGDCINVLFPSEDKFHPCEVISIEISDYLH